MEIQKLPELLDVVHSLIERKKQLRFALTGPSSRMLKRTRVDLLAGRVLNMTLHPFMARELGSRFDLGDALVHGTIPLVVEAEDRPGTLRAYVSLYLREEVQMEGLVRDIGSFSRFLETLSFSHAALLNVAEVARECGMERRTAAGHVEILEALLVAFRLRPFTRRARRAVVSHPKFYLFDAGVFRTLRPTGPLDRFPQKTLYALEEILGAEADG